MVAAEERAGAGLWGAQQTADASCGTCALLSDPPPLLTLAHHMWPRIPRVPADFKNVSIVGHYIKERTKNAQFVIISLRNNMFELADRLVGIYKTDNATKSVAINPHKFVVGAAPAAANNGHYIQPNGQCLL
jgi:hypothetical protein